MNLVTPKPDYPRPDLDRSARWQPLNGTWTLETDLGEQPITVPFAWETPASGVQRTWLEHATYRRTTSAPATWDGGRVFLCFGAVHHRATVRIDGHDIGVHTGGYTSFEFDITDAVRPGADFELTVEVEAPADKRAIPHGKQRSLPRDDYDGVSFTPSSGIWQSVWLEARGRTYLERILVRGDSCTGFDVQVLVAGDRPVGQTVEIGLDIGGGAEAATDVDRAATLRVDVPEPRLWSPDDPHLYTLTVRVGDDVVHVPAGLRRIECRGTAILLNGEPLYIRGVLDQGYWPGTGITAPDDAALITDLELARRSGYNLVRKHLKLEEPRFYHHADRLGLLVWAEPASTSRFSVQAAANFEAQIPDMVARDGNHPSIVIWGLYNEEWGLDWQIVDDEERTEATRRAYQRLVELDQTRPVVDNSGWSHTTTDLLDWHYYAEHPADWAAVLAGIADGTRAGFPVRLGPNLLVERLLNADGRPDDRSLPNLNSEYGGGFTSLERAWHLRWQTQELRRHPAFTGYVYTELTDIEHESAGIFDAERRPKDTGGFDPRDANAATVLIPDLIPEQAGVDLETPTSPWTIPVRISHHGAADLHGTVHAAWIPSGTPYAAGPMPPSVVVVPVFAQAWAVGTPIEVSLPPSPSIQARLLLWCAVGGDVVARTHIDVGPLEVGRAMSSLAAPLIDEVLPIPS